MKILVKKTALALWPTRKKYTKSLHYCFVTVDMPAFKGLKEIQNAVNLEFSSNEFITNSKYIVFSLDS